MAVGIIGTGSYLPEFVLSNAALAPRLRVDEEWILEKTGISERRVAAPEEATSDLAAKAGRDALRSAGIDPAELGIIILASGTFDQPSPATACFVQAMLNATNAIAFDVMATCAGFLYGIAIARDMLTADSNRRYALVIGAEVASRFQDSSNAGASALAGDGAGAVVLGKCDLGGILTSRLGSDGTYAELGQIPGGGSRRPASIETVAAGLHHHRMEGRKIRALVAELLPMLVRDAVDSIGIKISDLDHVVPHQANGVMLREWLELLGLSSDRMHQTVARFGNTGAASIPITLNDAVQQKRIQPGDNVLFVSFGAGVSWGATIIQWTHI